jgi:hypothetical protein
VDSSVALSLLLFALFSLFRALRNHFFTISRMNPAMTSESKLYIVAETEEFTETTIVEGARRGEDIGGGFSTPESTLESVTKGFKRKRVPIDALALKAQMDGLLHVVGELFGQADQQTGMKLNEVELSVEINAEGQVSLVGNGGKLGNTGGITLKFIRP